MTDLEAISIRTLRNDIASVIKRVESGESFDVTRYGQPVARLTPLASAKRPGTTADLHELRRRVPADPSWWAEIRAMREAGGSIDEHLDRLG